MWQVLDITTGETFWIERRTLAEKIITLYGTAKTSSPTVSTSEPQASS
jgi:hypothetical protein